MYPSSFSSGTTHTSDFPSSASELRKKQVQAQQAQMAQKQSAIQELMQKCTSLATSLVSLEATNLFDRKVDVQTVPPHSIQVRAGSSCPPNTYSIQVEKLASSSSLSGNTPVFQSLGEDPTRIHLKDIPVLEALKDGFCIIQGKKILVSEEDSLGDLITRIQNESGIQVVYNALEHTLEFQNQSPLRLGAPGDSSNLLELLGLFGKGGNTSLKSSTLLKLDFHKPLNTLPLKIPLASSGKFCINGLECAYTASEDSLQTVMDMLQNSPAQVILSYERQAHAFKLENKIKGALDIYTEDIEGNLLAALGLRGGKLNLGEPSKIRLNNTSYAAASSQIEAIDHGVQDLSIQVIALGEGTLNISVDIQGPKDKIESQLIKPFNEIQSFIQSKAAYITQGEKRLPGPLGEGDFTRFGDTVRRKLSGLDGERLEGIGSLQYLHQLGLSFTDRVLSLKDPICFEDQLKTQPQDVQKLLSSLAKSLRTYLEQQVQAPKGGKPEGWLYTKKEAVGKNLQDLQQDIEKINQRILEEDVKRKQDASIVSSNQRRMQQGSNLFPRASLF